MRLLAIDTSTKYLSVAVTKADKVVSRYHRQAPMGHSRAIISVIDKLLAKAGTRLRELDGFITSIGPGSFTGLRIGVTTIKTLALTLNKPVVTVPTLDAIAENLKGETKNICPVIDAKKEKVYACIYKSNTRNLKRLTEYLLLPIEALMEKIRDETLFLGDGSDVYREAILKKKSLARICPKGYWYPKASVVARLGAEKFKNKRFVNVNELVPFYVYSKECDIKGY